MESSKNTFPYRPLLGDRNPVRMLRLLPGKFDDPIRCEIQHTDLDDKPFFTALSYVWGDPNVTKPIHLRYGDSVEYTGPKAPFWVRKTRHKAIGQKLRARLDSTGMQDEIPGEPFVDFEITTNLDSALHYLRGETHDLYLWVDALCINQSDPDERGFQVRRMHRVYQQAREVRAWLGLPPMNDSQKSGAVEAASRYLTGKPVLSTIPFEDIAILFLDPPFRIPSREELDGLLVALLEYDWWTRVWVLPEAASGGTRTMLQIGRHLFPTFALCHMIAGLYILRFRDYPHLETRVSEKIIPTIAPFTRSLQYLVDSEFQKLRPMDRLVLLLGSLSHTLKSTDRRDRVYALLGLADPEGQSGIFPDYSRTEKEVFTSLAHLLVQNSKSLSWLEVAPPRYKQLPSWVPDWTKFAVPPKAKGLEGLLECRVSSGGLALTVRVAMMPSPVARVRALGGGSAESVLEVSNAVEDMFEQLCQISKSVPTPEPEPGRYPTSTAEVSDELATGTALSTIEQLLSPQTLDTLKAIFFSNPPFYYNEDHVGVEIDKILQRYAASLESTRRSDAGDAAPLLHDCSPELLSGLKSMVQLPNYVLVDNTGRLCETRGWCGDLKHGDAIALVPTCNDGLLLRLDGEPGKYRILGTLNIPGFTNESASAMRKILDEGEWREIEIV